MTNLEERLTQVLTARSVAAPPAEGLVEAARSRHLHRRRAQLGGATLALVAVLVPAGLLGFGITRGNPEPPQPLGPYKYGQHQQTSTAVPADRAPASGPSTTALLRRAHSSDFPATPPSRTHRSTSASTLAAGSRRCDC